MIARAAQQKCGEGNTSYLQGGNLPPLYSSNELMSDHCEQASKRVSAPVEPELGRTSASQQLL